MHARAYLELVERETAKAPGGAVSLDRRCRDRCARRSALRAGRQAARSPLSRRRCRGTKRSLLSCGHPGTTRSPIAAWVSASSTTLRSPREHIRPGLRSGTSRVLIVDFDYHHGNGTEAVAGEGLSYALRTPILPIRARASTSYRRGTDIVANVPLPSSGVSTETFVAVWQSCCRVAQRRAASSYSIVSAGLRLRRGRSRRRSRCRRRSRASHRRNDPTASPKSIAAERSLTCSKAVTISTRSRNRSPRSRSPRSLQLGSADRCNALPSALRERRRCRKS